jgi:hypothetical protein
VIPYAAAIRATGRSDNFAKKSNGKKALFKTMVDAAP